MEMYDALGPVAKLYETADEWEQKLVPRQRSLFHAVWGAYVIAELHTLNETAGTAWRQEQVRAEDWRAAGVYTASWLGHADRLARDIPPPGETTHNRDVIRAVIGAVRVRLREAGPHHDLVDDFVVPPEVAGDPTRLAAWTSCARAFGSTAADQDDYHASLEAVREDRAEYEIRGAIIRPRDDEAEQERRLRANRKADPGSWTSVLKNYFRGGNTLNTLPKHDQMHAQADAFFLDRYGDVEGRESPVDLLGTFPLFDLPDAAGLSSPDRTTTTSNTAYDWAARLSDLAWHMAFAAALATDYPAQATGVAAGLISVAADAEVQYASPTSVANPRPAAVVMVDDVWTGLGPVGEWFFDAVIAHVRGDDAADTIPLTVERIFRWLHDGRSVVDQDELFAEVNALAPEQRVAVANLAEEAIRRALQLDGVDDGGDRR